ncbi:DUF4252 domain-containing protein [Sphingobacterium sp. HJSM2_6]|uniref:DUF4252 domain-containing protein n=1 Tax=Sphingobacterium sp. HJSM2_6 TaxID=3366264 RepID=UPI003BDE35FA
MIRLIQLFAVAFFLLSLQSCFIKTRPNMAFVDKKNLSKQSEVVSIKIPSFLLKSFLRKEIREIKAEDPMMALALKKIKGLKMMTIEGTKDDQIHQNFSNYLVKNNFEEMMSLYSNGSKITINALTKKDRIRNVMLGINDGEDYVFVDLKTDINIDELSQLATYYEEQSNKKSKTD